MASSEELTEQRIKKLRLLKEKGINPYPAIVKRDYSIKKVLDDFDMISDSGEEISVTGRIKSLRSHGKAGFGDLDDGTASMQILFKYDNLKDYDFLQKVIDIGDFLEVGGRLFLTNKGERTVEVKSWRMISKSLKPLPEKWHSLKDKEERLRKRYLDILMNPEVKERFIKRSVIITRMRDFLDKSGFLEVETPILQALPGGALAKPFKTHLNSLDMDLYLRIAPELYLKRLLVAGFEKVYEIGRNFRNEGLDREHNPEFTMMECYASYWDYQRMMEFTEDLLIYLNQSETININGKEISLKKPWKKIRFSDLLNEVGINFEKSSVEDLYAAAKKLNVKLDEGMSKGKIADEIYKKTVREKMDGPVFIIDHPICISPLAKKKTDDTVERFQVVLAGMEIVNAFSELNDPLDQKERMMEQERQREEGDEESHRLDVDFIEALEYGMPPASGLGLGVDRLAAILTGSPNLREIILFPFMKPKDDAAESNDEF